MKLYITKYALTNGIIEVDTEILTDTFGGKFISVKIFGFHYEQFFGAKDFRQTRKSAIKKAEEMRAKKIASLKKQIEKLEKLSFE